MVTQLSNVSSNTAQLSGIIAINTEISDSGLNRIIRASINHKFLHYCDK